MNPQVASFIACLNVGWALPLFYADGVAWHFPWIVLGIIIGMACYFVIPFSMSRLCVTFGQESLVGKALQSLRYSVAMILACFLVLLMVKAVARYHGAA
jgi:uncharacterized protein YqhQ